MIEARIESARLIYTDEYNIYRGPKKWGYKPETVHYSIGELARDNNGGGFCQAHVGTIEEFWLLLAIE